MKLDINEQTGEVTVTLELAKLGEGWTSLTRWLTAAKVFWSVLKFKGLV